MASRNPPEPVMPGIVLEEFMRRANITQLALAAHLGISFQRVNEIARGKRAITIDTAALFAQAFRTTPEYWMELQLAWDLATYPYEVRKVKPLI